MIIETKYHGQVEVNEEAIWTFEQGIPGFADEKSFTLLSFPDNDLFFVLQSTKTPALGFIIASPFAFFPDYDIVLDAGTVEALELDQAEEAAIYTILTIREPFSESTANLQAPIVVNAKNKRAKQAILNDSRYQTRHTIMPAGAVKE
ncbi:flagellar assembly protein FliW [Bacillus badius]|uniref:flagellar assembly protein FliW n=1 Tax=Bacillus badius TaxID=1455 RepID=UPI001CBAF5E4|nr:flagellar assembly protein FliW [Bacillus badius]MED0668542.1 flagellar assembly protein FliW [Bacillus badius]UAT30352.1 flagellar assembly protein FliW [Bacillus badius]